MIRRPMTISGFLDHRGEIEDLLVEPLDGVTRISTRAGAIRGNHYHCKTVQYVYVLRGQLKFVAQEIDTRTDPPQLIADTFAHAELGPDELIVSQPEEAHAWQAITDTVVLVFTRGPRTGEGYDSDTYQLADDQKLIT